METEDRWYVRFRGHTLGPLTSDQVKASVRKKELGPEDKLASVRDPSWRPLRSQEEFLRCWESLSRPLPAELSPLPSPQVLWKKQKLPAASPRPAPSAGAHAQKAAFPDTKAPSPASSSPPASRAQSNAPGEKETKSKFAPKTKKPAPRKKPAAKPKIAAKPEPKLEKAAEPLPEKPAPVIQLVPSSPLPVSSRPEIASAPSASTNASAPLLLPEEALSLLASVREWDRKEQGRRPEPAPAPIALAPRPAIQPEPEPVPASPKKEIELHLTVSKQFIFISAAVAALALAALFFTTLNFGKMRGLEDSRLPGPSSPTVEPSAANDPIPQLKAPTRPNRD